MRVPNHVAIIMDGNGRWAKRIGKPRLFGHRKGAEAARKIVEYSKEKGIRFLTLYAFSFENWNRPQEEVIGLMNLLRRYLKSEVSELHKKGACVRVIGDRSRLDDDILSAIENLEQVTRNNKEITIQIALSYGSRQEIVHAVKNITKQVMDNSIVVDEIDEALISSNLMTAGIPDPDLVIRTSGERRISNYLLWQCAYAEFYFTETLWPDFTQGEFDKALHDYANRERRFGTVKGDEVLSHA